MTITIDNQEQAWIGKSSITGKWIICYISRNLIESDELGQRHGQFSTRKAIAV